MNDQPENDKPAAAVPTIFRFQEHEIRELTDAQGVPWFVAKDVCDILDIADVTSALRRIPELHLTRIQCGAGGQIREMNAVDEAGLYRLILRSDKPQAEPLMEFVTAEVLPSIRKTGSYAVPGAAPTAGHHLISDNEYIDLLRAKIAMLEHGKRKKANQPLTDENIAEILAMVASGMTQNEVARATQRSSATVSYLVRNKLREVQP